ncbi:unnamed protein product [Cyprideis torosa]|uniref:Uncharacterized protein n=1 Tax=Cyprideis torosa TaxID=163714 RepID=A0A7R8ZLS7_9CRUS|nr:unnamed protein product [Cyprideis torosa]CAG0884344.1 unnamed protein product [Cyprideis torosa]
MEESFLRRSMVPQVVRTTPPCPAKSNSLTTGLVLALVMLALIQPVVNARYLPTRSDPRQEEELKKALKKTLKAMDPDYSLKVTHKMTSSELRLELEELVIIKLNLIHAFLGFSLPTQHQLDSDRSVSVTVTSECFADGDNMAPIIVGYWDARGLCAPIEYILAYAHADFKRKRYNFGPPPENSKEEWLKEKDQLGLALPNLPYLIDGDTKLTQSLAIVHYLGRKFDLHGETCETKQMAEMIMYQAHDLRMALASSAYGSWSEEAQKELKEGKVKTNLEMMENVMSDKRLFIAGDKVTTSDFILYETLEWVLFMFPDVLSAYPFLDAFHSRIRRLPAVDDYINSDRFHDWPLFSSAAKFGFDPKDKELRDILLQMLCSVAVILLTVIVSSCAHHVPHTLADMGDWVDLSYPLSGKTLVWPNNRKFELFKFDHNVYRSNDFCTNEQVGTHIDSPSEFTRTGEEWEVHEIPLERLIVKGVVIDIRESVNKNPLYQLSEEDILDWERLHGEIPDDSVVFMYSGWGSHWANEEEYFSLNGTSFMFPGFSLAAVQWLIAKREVVGLGTDGPSVDYGKGKSEDYPIHRMLAENNFYSLEQVTNLDQLPPRGSLVLVAPLNARGARAAPVRIFGYVPKATSNYFDDDEEENENHEHGNDTEGKELEEEEALRAVYNHVTAADDWVDLTYPFDKNTTRWPTYRQLEQKQVYFEELGEGNVVYVYNEVCTSEHYGTHIDAPSHFSASAWNTDQIPLAHLLALPGVKIDVSEKAAEDPDYRVSVQDLTEYEEEYGEIPSGAVILISTGWADKFHDPVQYLGSEQYTEPATFHFPGVHEDATEFLIEEREVVAIGTDTVSVDYGQSKTFPTHIKGSENNIIFMENLANLDQLPMRNMTVILNEESADDHSLETFACRA